MVATVYKKHSELMISLIWYDILRDLFMISVDIIIALSSTAAADITITEGVRSEKTLVVWLSDADGANCARELSCS